MVTNGNGLGGVSPARLLAYFAVAVAVAFTGAITSYALNHGYFYGDDYSTFYLQVTEPFGRALLAPLGSQIVPLHRIVTFSTRTVAPMNYPVAVGVLLIFHAVAVIYLYRTLELIAHRKLNLVFVALYAVYVSFGPNLIWFTSGMTRFPYIAFATAATYYYLHYTKTQNRRDLALVALSYLLALGFYSKAILIPLVCVGLDVALHGPRGAARLPEGAGRAKWIVIGVLCAVSAVYVGVMLWTLHAGGEKTTTNWLTHVVYQKVAWAVFANSLFDRILYYEHPTDVPSILPVLPWFGVAAYTIYRSRSLVWVWLVAGVWIIANVLIIATSNRTVAFGIFMAFESRHYYELCFVLVLLLAIVAERLSDAPEIRRLSSGGPAVVSSAVLAALFALHGAFAYRGFTRLFESAFGDMQASRRYMRQLQNDLDKSEIRDDPEATFVDKHVPMFLDPIDFSFQRQSQLFEAIGVKANYGSWFTAKYAINNDGHVFRILQRPIAYPGSSAAPMAEAHSASPPDDVPSLRDFER